MSINKKFSAYKSRAKNKGIRFSLNKKQFQYILAKPCYYCKTNDNLGIDRINNDKGYVSNNVVSCCWDCNRSKSNKTEEEYKDYVKRFGGSFYNSLEDIIKHKTELFMLNPKLGNRR